MSPAAGWSASAALAHHPRVHWSGSGWRGHNRRYTATDYRGALRSSGRYHRASDLFPTEVNWPALYLALAPHTAIAEIDCQLTPQTWHRLGEYRFSELRVSLSAVLDCRNSIELGVTVDDLCRDFDWEVPQALAQAARERGAEAILVPSATRWGDNLIVFPDILRPSSALEPVGSVDPRLYREPGG